MNNGDFQLYPYQKQGVEFLLEYRHALLADEPGLGKTAQALLALEAARGYPALIVCPASVKSHWAHQLFQWLGRTAFIVQTGKDVIPNVPVVICNYDLLKVVEAQGREFCTVICDEFFYCKTAEAQRTRFVKRLTMGAQNVWALSGTPIINRPAELVSQLDILGMLQRFGGRWPFLYRYCDPHKQVVWITRFDRIARRPIRKQIEILNITGAARLGELHERLSAYCMLRRLKKDVASQLPDQQSIPLQIDLDAKGRALYDAARKDLAAWVRANKGEGAVSKMRANEALTKLTYMRQVAAQAKINRLIQAINDLLETDEKVVLFAFSRPLQTALLNEWPTAAHLLGDDSMIIRQSNIDRFRRDPDCRLMVASLKASAFGTDGLQHAARYVIFCDLGDESKTHEQAIDRLHRLGQTKDVTAYYAVASDTIEEAIMERLITKHQITSIVSDGKVIEELLDAA